MAAVTLNLYDTFRMKQASGDGAVDLTAVTVKAMVVTGSYSPDQDAHDFADDLGANEVSGSNYTAGGNALANFTASVNATSGLVTVDCDDPTAWSQHASGFSNGRRVIIYVDRGGASSADELIAYSDDFGADKGNVDGDFTVQINSSGLFTSAR